MTLGGRLQQSRFLLGLLTVVVLAAGLPSGMDGLLALAVVLTAGLAAVIVVAGAPVRIAPPSGPARIRVVVLRECARHTAFLRLRDPAAPGRSRPRAPSAAPAAA